MKLRTLAFTLLAACSLFACETISDALPEYTVGAKEGVPPVSGSTTIDVPQDFKCGEAINDPEMKYTITTSGTAEACTFTFKQDVMALKASDYADRPELEGARFVKRVDIEVKTLAVKDGSTGEKLAPEDLTGKAFGSTILTLADLEATPPFTKSVEGKPLEALKAKVENKQDIVIPIEVVIVVNMSPTPPAKIALDFDAQPNLVFGF
jgi:hypothetical protein